jgi:aminoglycoside phosphotransferase
VTLPRGVEAVIAGRPFNAVWRNELGGLTLEIEDQAGNLFLKWAPNSNGRDLLDEVARCRWASRFVPVPKVVDFGSDADGSWFLSEAISAENAVSEGWKARPEVAARAIGSGLRALHERLPVDQCRYTWSVQDRLQSVEEGFAEDRLARREWDGDLFDVSAEEARLEVRAPPPLDLVVCHGDACAPNTLISRDGSWAAHVDLGNLGVADRWADLAVAAWSTVWNYGHGWENAVYESYGIKPDLDKIRYYRLLWALE